jgi:hypothetical protein
MQLVLERKRVRLNDFERDKLTAYPQNCGHHKVAKAGQQINQGEVDEPARQLWCGCWATRSASATQALRAIARDLPRKEKRPKR